MSSGNDRDRTPLQELYVKASTKKGALTRSKKALDFSIKALQDSPSSDHFAEELKKNLKKYRDSREVVLDIYDNIETQIEHAKFTKDFGKQQSEIESDYEKIEDAARIVLAAHHAAVTAAAARGAHRVEGGGSAPDPQHRAPPWKLQTSFQPKTLLKLDSVTNDFHCWQREFQFFYDMSNLKDADIQIQRTVLLNCLHQDFQTKISEAMTAVSAIEDGLALIEHEFRKRHPQIIRRHELFCLDQQQDEKFSDTVTRMMTLAKDSNLVDMSRDQILCHILLRACSRDDELRGKLLEIDSDTMTLDQLVAIVERYELIQVTNKGLSKNEKGFGRQVRSKEGNRCFCCQDPRASHIARNCPVDKKTLFCQNCSDRGLPPPHAHNTFAQCKGTQSGEKGDKGEAGKDSGAKGRRIHARGLSPAGDPESSDDEQVFARRARAEEPKSDDGWSEDDSGNVSVYTDEEEEAQVDADWPIIESTELRYRNRILHEEQQLPEVGSNTTPPAEQASPAAALALATETQKEQNNKSTVFLPLNNTRIEKHTLNTKHPELVIKDSEEMKCSQLSTCSPKIGGAIIVVVLLLLGACLVKWLSGGGDDSTTTNEPQVSGSGNQVKVKSESKHEVSLLHIENLASGLRATNIFMVAGFVILLLLFGSSLYHNWIVKRSNKKIKDMEMNELMDKMKSVEEELISRGFLSEKKKGKKPKQNKKGKKSSKIKNRKKMKDIEAQSEDSSGSED